MTINRIIISILTIALTIFIIGKITPYVLQYPSTHSAGISLVMVRTMGGDYVQVHKSSFVYLF